MTYQNYTASFSKISCPFSTCNLALQRDAPQIHHLRSRFHELFTNLLIRFVKTSAISKCSNIFSVEHTDKKNRVCRSELKIGSKARELLTQLKDAGKISTHDEDGFVTDVRQFLSASLQYVIDKFPLDDEVLENAQVLDVRGRERSKEAMLSFFATRFNLCPKEKLNDLHLEFAKFKLEHLPEDVEKEEDVSKQWFAISKIKTLDFDNKYQLLFRVMTGILSIAHSNADSERLFSLVRKNHTEFRSSMSTQTLSSLMIVKSLLIAEESRCFDVTVDDALLARAKSATTEVLQGLLEH